MKSDLSSKIFMKGHEIGAMDSGYVWITTYEFNNL